MTDRLAKAGFFCADNALSISGCYKMIVDRLGISLETVRQHIKNIYRKLHVNSMGQAIVRSIRGEI